MNLEGQGKHIKRVLIINILKNDSSVRSSSLDGSCSFFQCKCVLRVEQQHSFGIHSYYCLFVCFLVWGGLFFLRKKDQLFILNVVELPLYLVLCLFVDILTHSLEWLKRYFIFSCVTNKCENCLS